MNHDTGIGAYFQQNAPSEYKQATVSRAVNALRRKGVSTMRDLCAIPAAELLRIRSLGERSLGLVTLMQSKWSESAAGRH